MNPTLLHSSFPLDGPINSDSDYAGTQRHFSGSAGFSMDDEENGRRSGAVGNHLVQPVSIPATNSLRYNTQQSTMQDVSFATSPILMSPPDSCSETFSPTPGSLYSHSPALSYDRMSDFRPHRVPPLQPPTGQSQGNASLLGRNDTYPGGYAIHRSAFPSISSLNDIPRVSPYANTPRILDCTMDRSQNLMFGQATNMFVESAHRLPQAIADAPPFHDTNVLHHVISGISGNQMIKPEIHAKIHKGFFQVDEKWTCYRRNYFSISCSFSLEPWARGPFYIKFSEQATEQIRQFSMTISAIVNAQYGEIRELVQHTPKRDKQSERKPEKVIMQPSTVGLSHGSTTNGGQHGFSLMSQSGGMPLDYNSTYNGAPQPPQPPTQHTFERIQFQKATANNGKRRAQQQYYNLVVELYAQINPGGGSEAQWIKIARKLSHRMVVRGRSPGHYKDGRRDSSTSMGPDGGNGGSGDGNGGAVLPPSIGQAARSHLGLMSYDSSQRGGHNYGRNDYHQMTAADQSPLSESPHISSSASSNFDIGILNDPLDPIDSLKSTASMESYQDPNFGVVDSRKENQYRHHLPPFDYDPVPKNSEDSGASFPEAYDSLVSMIPHEQADSPSPFLKHPPRTASQGYHPSPGGYVYSNRSRSGSGPYYRIPNSQSLCA